MRTLLNFIRQIITITEYETLKIIRTPTELFSRSLQPVLWLLIFGQVFARIHMEIIGQQSYVLFIAPGIMAQSVLFVSIFYGLAIIWERDLGIMHKILVSPTSRNAIILGKGIAASIRSITQVIVVLLLVLLMQLTINWSLFSILGIIFFISLEAIIFSTLSTIVACIVKTRERFMGIGQVITMPLFFASNAIYPITIMPHWLQIIATWNPLTYEVDALRAFMLPNTISAYGLMTDFFILSGTMIALIIIGGWMYPKIIR
jgi:ABC-2 type transport system permease protein